MKRTFIPLLLLALTLPAEVGDTLTLRAQASVFQSAVTLGDLVVERDRLPGQSASLIMAAAPAKGAPALEMSRREVLEKARANGYNLNLGGPSRISILRAGIHVSPETWIPRIKELVAHTHPGASRIEVALGADQGLDLPRTAVTWRITPAGGDDLLDGSLLRVEALDHTEHVLASRWITPRITLTREVAVTQMPLNAGTLLTGEMVRWETRSISGPNRQAIWNPEECLGKRLSRSLAPNTVLCTPHLAPERLVRRGALARLTVSCQGVVASRQVKVLSDGGRGDQVSVMIPTTRTLMNARVSGPGEVEVRLP